MQDGFRRSYSQPEWKKIIHFRSHYQLTLAHLQLEKPHQTLHTSLLEVAAFPKQPLLLVKEPRVTGSGSVRRGG